MADCNRILDFSKEFKLMCQRGCNNCCFNGCISLESITQGHINTLQKWSDTQVIETRQNEFLKIFPNAEMDDDNILNLCPFKLNNETNCVMGNVENYDSSVCKDCRKEYWSMSVERKDDISLKNIL